MSLPIVWRAKARTSLREIVDYISDRNPAAAERLRERIEQLVEGLSLHPYMCRLGRIAGTRECVAHPNYLVVYRVETDRVLVLQVVHARRQYP